MFDISHVCCTSFLGLVLEVFGYRLAGKTEEAAERHVSLSKGPLQERDVKALSKECKQFIENLFKESNQEVLCHEIISFCEDFIAKRLTAQNENLFTKMQDREKFALQTLKTARSQVGEDDNFDDNNLHF